MHVPNIAHIAKPLTNLTHIGKANESILSQEKRDAFKQLTATLCDAHNLYVLIPGQLYILHTDASGNAKHHRISFELFGADSDKKVSGL